MNDVADRAELCVIGAGVMGALAAFELAVRGVDVLLLERSAPGLEASAATAGTLGIQNKHLAAIPLVVQALQLWATLSERLGYDVEYEKRGGFRLAHTDEDIAKLEQGVRAQRELGIAVELLYQPELARAAPYLSPAVRAASFCPDDGMANPLATMRALVTACRREGVRLWTGTPVRAIEAPGDHDFLLDTPRGRVRCSTVLAAAGTWNGDVARLLGVALPVTTEIQQVFTTDCGPPLFPHIVTHVRGNLTMKQARTTGKVLVGGAWPGDGDPATGEKRVRRASLIGSARWATQVVPGLARTQLLRAWVGFEGRTPDKLLLSGPVGAPAGFHVLGCASGGFTLAPIAARIAAEYVTNGSLDPSWAPFHVQRFLSRPMEPPTGTRAIEPQLAREGAPS